MTSTMLNSSFALQSFLWDLQARGISPQAIDALEAYIRSCWDEGVNVINDPGLERAYVYDPESNTLSLGFRVGLQYSDN